MSKGLFGGMFDFNGDGDLDVFEQAGDFALFAFMMEEEDRDPDDEYEDDD